MPSEADILQLALMYLFTVLFSSTWYSNWQTSRCTMSLQLAEFVPDIFSSADSPLACRSSLQAEAFYEHLLAFARYATSS